MASGKRPAIRRVEAELGEVVLVCRKCSKKVGPRFGAGGDQKLAKALRREVEARERAPSGRRKALARATAVIEVGCLDLCPKGAVVAFRAGRPDDWLLVREGATVAEIIDGLGINPSPASGSA